MNYKFAPTCSGIANTGEREGEGNDNTCIVETSQCGVSENQGIIETPWYDVSTDWMRK